MTGSANDVILSKHLGATATKTKKYVLKELLTLSQAIADDIANLQGGGSTVLDTVPASVNGSLWYELNDGEPVINFFVGDCQYSLSPSIVNRNPNLTISPAAVTLYPGGTATASVSYLGSGAVTVSGGNASYDPSSKTISVPFDYTGADANVKVSLSASKGFFADSAYLSVTMSFDIPIAPD